MILGLGVAKELEELEEFDELDVLDELGEKNEVIDLVFLDDEGLGWLLRRFIIFLLLCLKCSLFFGGNVPSVLFVTISDFVVVVQ